MIVLGKNIQLMKRINFLLLFILCISFSAVTAQNEGTIIFTETVKLNIEAPEGMEEMFKDLPKSQSSEKKLIFKDGKSLYTIHKSDDYENESTVEGDMGTTVMKIKIHQPDNRTYTDHNDGKVVARQELMQKPFLIKDDMKKYDWKVTSERRQILDHQCMKATAKEDDNEIVAWFSPQIPFGIGPNEYNGLPGAILMVELNGGEREIVAKSINLEPVNSEDIVMPEKGKKVKQSEIQTNRKGENGRDGERKWRYWSENGY